MKTCGWSAVETLISTARLVSAVCGWNTVEIISAIFQPLQPQFNRARKCLTSVNKSLTTFANSLWSIDTAIDSQQTVLFWGRSWTFFVQRRNFDFVPKMRGDTVWQEQMKQVSEKGKQNVFSVSLTTIILNCFLCMLDERSRERIKTWAGLHFHETRRENNSGWSW